MHGLSGRSSIVRKTAKSIKVKQIKLDDLASILKCSDFIKIDVEGSELEVVKGAFGIICRDKPVLIIETSQKNLPELKKVLGKYYRLCTNNFGGLHLICMPYD